MAISKKERWNVLQRDGFRCQYCGFTGADTELHVDHILPVSRGGTDHVSNLITACKPCNLGKFTDIGHTLEINLFRPCSECGFALMVDPRIQTPICEDCKGETLKSVMQKTYNAWLLIHQGKPPRHLRLVS